MPKAPAETPIRDQLLAAAREAMQKSNISFTRSPDFKTIFANFFRTRTGNGDLSIFFMKATHNPGFDIEGNILEEQVEVVITWQQVKMIAGLLASVVNAIEAEIGPITTPDGYHLSLDAQRESIRNLHLSRTRSMANLLAEASAPTDIPDVVAAAPDTKPRQRQKGRRIKMPPASS